MAKLKTGEKCIELSSKVYWRVIKIITTPSNIGIRFGNLYTEQNVAISGTHTHAGPGGYLQYVVYSVTSLGFVEQSFDAIANAIEQSIIQAHNNLKPGSIFMNIGDVKDAGINRSPSAYLQNPAEERARYPTNVDTQMTLLRFMDGASGKSIGAFSWFATHGTSMSRDNKLISGDNKGVAARLFEDWFASQNKSSSSNTNSTEPGIKNFRGNYIYFS
ncbi:neutral ceramidase 2-like [Cajanus cajan]|uniref:neutral ceramidase 2-like n=1 Tax=Cajanus cajan TaxID=3821 RepID=UPI0010FB52AF|nr:neutral ceramidase 2-like [Cajanus cajan]